ncbi:hypothetical protein KIN20_018590 [Parelaphostrongylus tenuis]|uniref:Uncharacterized protein n=1 Tax=Parelaphostrongylus tenuis TaxID=148309 RepID=A0AAD5QRL6_PARTN|nr:hypothetical protein KIN20_018590 [Parelaphostrongylus tenuis]
MTHLQASLLLHTTTDEVDRLNIISSTLSLHPVTPDPVENVVFESLVGAHQPEVATTNVVTVQALTCGAHLETTIGREQDEQSCIHLFSGLEDAQKEQSLRAGDMVIPLIILLEKGPHHGSENRRYIFQATDCHDFL